MQTFKECNIHVLCEHFIIPSILFHPLNCSQKYKSIYIQIISFQFHFNLKLLGRLHLALLD